MNRNIIETKCTFFKNNNKFIIPEIYIAINYPYTEEDL